MRHQRSGLLRSVLFVSCCASVSASAAELVVNGSFETNGGINTNTFTGWTEADQAGGSGSIYAQSGTTPPPPAPGTVPAPPLGSFAAMSSQGGPGSHVLYQNISIPAGFSAKFFAKVFVGNQAAHSRRPPPWTIR
jgi:hypothetical protein